MFVFSRLARKGEPGEPTDGLQCGLCLESTLPTEPINHFTEEWPEPSGLSVRLHFLVLDSHTLTLHEDTAG